MKYVVLTDQGYLGRDRQPVAHVWQAALVGDEYQERPGESLIPVNDCLAPEGSVQEQVLRAWLDATDLLVSLGFARGLKDAVEHFRGPQVLPLTLQRIYRLRTEEDIDAIARRDEYLRPPAVDGIAGAEPSTH